MNYFLINKSLSIARFWLTMLKPSGIINKSKEINVDKHIPDWYK